MPSRPPSFSNIPSLDIAPMELWFGDPTLLTHPCAVILNSRQNRYPTGAEKWVSNTIKGAGWVSRNEHTLLTGVGMKTWELALWAAGEALGAVAVLVGVRHGQAPKVIEDKLIRLIRDFGLTQTEVVMIPYFESGRSSKEQWLARDKWLIEKASVLIPVSVREKGFMQNVLASPPGGKKVLEDYRTPWNPRRYSFAKTPDSAVVHQALSDLEWSFLTHWTRTSSTPWPGESSTEFYSAIVEGTSNYPRSALETLKRIVSEKRIRATDWKMPGGRKLASFTAAHPAEFVERMTYRRQYARQEYEPFGVAIHRDALQQVGARQVRYGTVAAKALPLVERLFFQTNDGKTDWTSEQEWRLSGDLDLGNLDTEAILLLVPDQAEAEVLASIVPWKVRTLSGTS